jgi:hypothetical protein
VVNVVASSQPLMGVYLGIVVGFIGSFLTTALVWAFHYLYTKNIYGAFERGSKDEDPVADRLMEKTKFEIDYNTEESNNLTYS